MTDQSNGASAKDFYDRIKALQPEVNLTSYELAQFTLKHCEHIEDELRKRGWRNLTTATYTLFRHASEETGEPVFRLLDRWAFAPF